MDEYSEINRDRWDKLAEMHFNSDYYGLQEFRKGKSSLFPIEMKELPDIKGKKLLHLQCHFGLDTLSLARMGADVTGVDYSEKAIELAQGLSESMDNPARFISSDIYALDEQLSDSLGSFDIVYTSYGVLCWLPDLEEWAKLYFYFSEISKAHSSPEGR